MLSDKPPGGRLLGGEVCSPPEDLGSWMIRRAAALVFIAASLVLSGPAVAQAPEEFVTFEADLVRVDAEGRQVATGSVRAVYRDYAVTSGRAVLDPDTNVATFEENVVLSTRGIQVRAERLTLDLDTRDWEVTSATSSLAPEAFKSGVLSPVYVSGRSLLGTEQQRVDALESRLTTCSLPAPHYLLRAREVEVFPGRRLTARGVTLYALGHKVVSLPVFSVPLNRLRDRTNLIPQIGQTAAEGTFLKTAYNYIATDHNTGSLKLDAMSRKGFGQGLEHNYNFTRATGSLTAYHLYDRTLGTDSLTGRFAHNQRLGSITMDVTSDYRSNSYQYAPNTTSSSTELRFRRGVQDVNTELRIRRGVTGGFGRFETLTSVLSHRQKLFGGDAAFTFDYGRFGSPSASADNEELSSRAEFFRQLKRYDMRLNLSKRYDLDEDEFTGDDTFSSLDRLPELILESDTGRLGRALPFGVPAALSLSLGSYHEEPLGVETERMVFEVNTRPARDEPDRPWDLDVTAGFRQAFYGNQAAQYVIRTNTDLTRRLGGKSSFNLRYRYQRPRGASAFRFDFASIYNVLTANLNIRETEKFRLTLNGGYNFAFKTLPWQDISLKTRYSPSSRLAFYTSTGYDVNRSKWRGLINQLRIRAPWGFNLDLGTRYDIERSKLASTKAQLETPLGKQTKLQAVAGYNGFRKKFDYRAIMLTQDLHCWEASLVYVDQSDFFDEKGFRFNLRIKAFPVFQQFGVGQRGQSLTDTSVGDQF